MKEEEENKKRLAALEAEFESVAAEARAKIDEHLKVAEKAINEAIKISREYGVPFHSNVSGLPQHYVPSSFNEKYYQLDKDFVEKAAKTWLGEDLHYTDGWEKSDFC